jgi:hypothetical protein
VAAVRAQGLPERAADLARVASESAAAAARARSEAGWAREASESAAAAVRAQAPAEALLGARSAAAGLVRVVRGWEVVEVRVQMVAEVGGSAREASESAAAAARAQSEAG